MTGKSWKRAALFELPQINIPSPLSIKKELSQITDVRKISTKKSITSLPLEKKLEVIRQSVYSILGRYKDFVRVIRDEKELSAYIDQVIEKGIGCLDTETNNSLDPITCKIMGVCLYYPNSRPVYVPMNHTVPGTDIRLEGQIDEKFMGQMIRRLKESGVKVIYHNGKFDLRVIYNTLGLYPPIWWDTMIAAQLLNEDEIAKLKNQYRMHVNPTMSPYEIEKLFLGVPYAWVDIELFALYAAIDAYDTYRLYEYQQRQFRQMGMGRLYNLFLNIEMPVVTISAQMEDAGVCVETEFLKRVDAKCRVQRDAFLKELTDTLAPYKSEVEAYQAQGKLDTPINFESSSQLQLVLYNILKAPIISEDGKRSTDKDTLKALKLPFTEALLKYRKVSKLINAFTTPLPNWLSPKDGKLHASFNQLGKEDNNVRTGRFSSTDPKFNWGFVA